MSSERKQLTLNYIYKADLLLREALPFHTQKTKYLHLCSPSKRDSGYYDFSNYIRLGIVKGLPYEQEALYATYFHETGHMFHYTATKHPYVSHDLEQKNQKMFQQLLETAQESPTLYQLKKYYSQDPFKDYLLFEPELIARMIESYCLHFHEIATKTKKNRVPFWQFSEIEVSIVPIVLKQIYPLITLG